MNKHATFEAVYLPPDSEDEVWRDAPEYEFSYSRDRSGRPREGARVRFAWSEQGLYVRAALDDSFLVSTDRRDEQLHFQSGDVFELFVKPLHDDYYWEMYATPFGNKSTLFFPREREQMTVAQHLKDHDFHGLDVASETISEGWKTRLFVPVSQLTALGAGWGDGTPWAVFCGRYNYNSEDLQSPELSMAPPLSATNYHLTNEYAELDLLRSSLNR